MASSTVEWVEVLVCLVDKSSETISCSCFDWTTSGESCGAEVAIPSEVTNIGYEGSPMIAYVIIVCKVANWSVPSATWVGTLSMSMETRDHACELTDATA